MRALQHGVEGKVGNLSVLVTDDPGHGGACHSYLIEKPDGTSLCRIDFQNGPINDSGGINGIQNEDLLAIVIDRLEGFQSGKYACDHNQAALMSCRAALAVLQSRTAERILRGVEGTHTV